MCIKAYSIVCYKFLYPSLCLLILGCITSCGSLEVLRCVNSRPGYRQAGVAASCDSLPVARSTCKIVTMVTSSSAVAKRPRDASCLSVVSFSSTKCRAQSSIVSYVGYGFITAYN